MKLIKKLRKGFTLIELVVVIAVIAILAAISVISYLSITNKAKESNDHMVIDQVNTLVQGTSYQSRKATVHDLVSELDQTDGFDMRKIQPELQGTEFVYCFDENMFGYWKDGKVVYPKKLVDKLGSNYAPSDVWFFRDGVSSSEEEHSIYLKATPASGEVTTAGGLDVGDQKDIKKITLQRGNTSAGGDLVIRTQGGTLTVNAPKDTVKHYGEADKVDVQAIFSSSYHENGTVQLIAVKEGHVKLEGNADVNGIYVYNNSVGETKDTSFKDVKITVDSGVEVPKLSRSAVQIADEGTKVCTIVTDQAKDVYLFNEGIYEQIKTVDEGKPITDTSASWADSSSNTTNTQTAAQQLANEWTGRDENGKIENQTVEVSNVEYTVVFNNTSREFETYANYNEETKTGDKVVVDTTASAEEQAAAQEILAAATAKVEETAKESGKTAADAEKASALKGTGTKADPFLVYDYETMQKISDFYSSGCYYYKVDISKTNNGTIDCTNWQSLKLNGYFDGSGVKLVNLDNNLFYYVKGNNWSSTLSNFDVEVSSSHIYSTHDAPIVYYTYSSITFNNVNVSGTAIGYAIASYIGQIYSDNTLEYTFNNCISSLNICGYGEYAAGFIGYSNLGASYNGNGPIALELNESYFIGTLMSVANYYYSWGNNTGWFTTFSDNSANKDQYVSSTWNGNSKQLIGGTYLVQARNLTTKSGTVNSLVVGDTLSVEASAGSTVCDILTFISPNDTSEEGSYTGLYYKETVSVVDGNFTSVLTKKWNITINGDSTTSTGLNGNTFNVVDDFYGHTHNGYTVYFVEYSNESRTTVTSVTAFSFGKSN